MNKRHSTLRVGLALLIALPVFAVGPKIKYHILTWTPSPSAGVTGYWVYWRAPSSHYSDANRLGVSTNSNTLDLMPLGFTNGIYVFAMSSTNAAGNESALSNEAIWNSELPTKPIITGITQ